ncbi:MAG: TonB-dependent receptor [Steroidobacteraceae bacterium]
MNKFLQRAAALLAPAAFGVAHAQTPGNADVMTLETVVVSAQKRLENVKDVPISITAISAMQLQESAAKTLVQLQGTVPGFTIQGDRSYGGAALTIRGTGGNASPLQDDPVATYVDGVYRPPNYFGTSGLFDIASLEIVRGPQGTLQGRNATAGAILVRNADPEETFGGYLSASVADPTDYRVQTAITGPITDTLSARLAVNYFDEKGWGKNVFNGDRLGGEKVRYARGVALWRPTENARVRLSADYLQQTSRQALARWATTTISPPPGPAVLVSTPQIPLTGAQMDEVLEHDRFNSNISNRSENRAPSAALEASYDFGPVELVSVTGAYRYEIDGTTDSDALPFTDRHGYNTARLTGRSLSEELRLQSNGDTRLRWLLGAYWSTTKSTFLFDIFNLTFTVPTDRYSDFRARQTNDTAAAFADATFKLTDQLSLTGGVRYTEETKDFDQQFRALTFPASAPLVVAAPLIASKTWNDVSYRGILNYQPAAELTLYLSYSKGFKSGGYNAFSVGVTPAYNPETLKSAELGVKADLFGHRAYLAASVYDNSYQNLQVVAGVPAGGVIVTNAAEASIRGAEVEATFRATANLRLEGNAAWIDATYDTFRNAPNLSGALVDVSGNRLINTPKWQYLLQGTYDFELNGNWGGFVQLGWRWRDKMYFLATNQDLRHLRSEQDGELNARVNFALKPQALSISLYGTNLNDDRVLTGAALAFNYPSVNFNKPRTVGIEVRKDF